MLNQQSQFPPDIDSCWSTATVNFMIFKDSICIDAAKVWLYMWSAYAIIRCMLATTTAAWSAPSSCYNISCSLTGHTGMYSLIFWMHNQIDECLEIEKLWQIHYFLSAAAHVF